MSTTSPAGVAGAATVAQLDPQGRVQGLPDHLVIRQLYLGCLSQASYLVGDRTTGRAVAVDPRRDVEEILAAAEDDGLTIEWVVETHFHADFLSGHLELAAATGATIGIGSRGATEFASHPLADGEVLDLGGVQVEVLHTPGHTPESISLVVRAAAGADPAAVLTGDTLFIGDVGRPDLLASVGVSASELGASLYTSVSMYCSGRPAYSASVSTWYFWPMKRRRTLRVRVSSSSSASSSLCRIRNRETCEALIIGSAARSAFTFSMHSLISVRISGREARSTYPA